MCVLGLKIWQAASLIARGAVKHRGARSFSNPSWRGLQDGNTAFAALQMCQEKCALVLRRFEEWVLQIRTGPSYFTISWMKWDLRSEMDKKQNDPRNLCPNSDISASKVRAWSKKIIGFRCQPPSTTSTAGSPFLLSMDLYPCSPQQPYDTGGVV